MNRVLGDIRQGAFWFMSFGGLGASISLAWMISIYGEMFPGYASTGGDNCVLARAGAVMINAAWNFGSYFLGSAFVAFFVHFGPYVMNVCRVVGWEWSLTPLPPISRAAALRLAFCQTIALFFVAWLDFKAVTQVLDAVRGETYISIMDAQRKFQVECDTVRRQP